MKRWRPGLLGGALLVAETMLHEQPYSVRHTCVLLPRVKYCILHGSRSASLIAGVPITTGAREAGAQRLSRTSARQCRRRREGGVVGTELGPWLSGRWGVGWGDCASSPLGLCAAWLPVAHRFLSPSPSYVPVRGVWQPPSWPVPQRQTLIRRGQVLFGMVTGWMRRVREGYTPWEGLSAGF